jgi:hypothetical protein
LGRAKGNYCRLIDRQAVISSDADVCSIESLKPEEEGGIIIGGGKAFVGVED